MLGAGPAGLTAAYTLARRGRPAVVFEADGVVGGIAKTVEFQGYRFDLGGHRFFTKSEEVRELWEEILGDELLVRSRLSRIYWRGRLRNSSRMTSCQRSSTSWDFVKKRWPPRSKR